MLEQLALDGNDRAITVRGRTLTAKQQTALDFVRATAGGVSADELGAYFHSQRSDRWRHPEDQRCVNCARDGLSLLRSGGLRSLVIRRRATSLWEMRDPKQRAREPSAQLAGLPEWLENA